MDSYYVNNYIIGNEEAVRYFITTFENETFCDKKLR